MEARKRLRRRRQRRGGDEIARTQEGNNNAYCHDSPLNWFDWTLLQKNAGIFSFTKNMIAFRKAHQELRRSVFFDGSVTLAA